MVLTKSILHYKQQKNNNGIEFVLQLSPFLTNAKSQHNINFRSLQFPIIIIINNSVTFIAILLQLIGALFRALQSPLLLLLILYIHIQIQIHIPIRFRSVFLSPQFERVQQFVHRLVLVAPVLDQHLADIGRRHRRRVDHRLELLRRVSLQIGLLEPQVVLQQNLERREGAVAHVNVHVHSPAPQQCGIELLDMICCEHENPLAPAARPQPIREIQQAGKSYRVPAVLAAVCARRRGDVVGILPGGGALIPVGQINGAVDVLDDNNGL